MASGLNSSTCLQGNCSSDLGTVTFPSDLFYGTCRDSYWTALVGTIIILVLGIIGNSLSIFVTLRTSLRRNPFFKYLTALAVIDSVHCIFGCSGTLLPIATNGAFHNRDIIGCGANVSISIISASISSHLLVAVSIERYISISYPLKAFQWFSYRRNALAITLIVVLNIAFISPVSMYTVLEKIIVNGQMHNRCLFLGVPDIYVFSMGLLYSFAPLIIIATMNILIMKALIQRQATTARLNNGSNSLLEQRRAEVMKTIPVILSVCISFIVTTTPVTTMLILAAIKHKWSYLDLQEVDPCPLYIFWTIITLLRLVNYSINFYMYCLTGSHFRKELYKLIHGKDELNTITTTGGIGSNG